MASAVMPVTTMPARTPMLGVGGSVSSSGPVLYGGQTNVTGMPTPMNTGFNSGSSRAPGPGRGLAPTPQNMPASGAMPASGSMSATPFQPTQAPNMLNVTPTGTPGTPTSGAMPVGAPGTATGTMSGLTSRQASRVLGENQNYFGEGMGSLLTNYLQTGAGYSGPMAQQAISATQAAMQQQINQQYGTLQTSMANAGLSPDSSGFQLGQAEFLSNASAQENAVAAQQYTQMYSQSQTDYQNALLAMAGVNATGTANQRTFMGGLGSFLSSGLSGLFQYEGGAAGMSGQVNTGGSSQAANLAMMAMM